MPYLISTVVKARLGELDMSTEFLAIHTKINWGSLRNALAGRDPISEDRAKRIAKALGLALDDITTPQAGRNGEGVPDEPPDQPTQPTGPCRRTERETRRSDTGPKRVTGQAA